MKLVHIADVHWRGLSRHEEYRKSFTEIKTGNDGNIIQDDGNIKEGNAQDTGVFKFDKV